MKRRRLPARLVMEVEGPGGRRYPAWIVRWSRKVFSGCGPIGPAVPIVLIVPGSRIRPSHAALVHLLCRWGYRRVSLETNLYA